jgi:hypothetical protein
MMTGPYIQAWQVKNVQPRLKLQIASAFPHSLQSRPCDGQPNVEATLGSRMLLVLLC